MTLFADPSFFVLLAVVLVPAAALGLTGHNLRRYALAVSVLFLACAVCDQPWQALAVLAFLLVEWFALRLLARDPGDGRRFAVATVLSLAPLVTYKVSLAAGVPLWGFVGISYVTFKAVQVVVETRDGLIAPDALGLDDYLSFLLFFPQLSSGPIDRSRRFLADAHRTPGRDEYAGLLARGILLLLAGATYYLVFATLAHRYMASVPWDASDPVGSLATQVGQAWLYALYLFFDFAGYSLMAMGASYCLGIRCPRNFRAPFIARDLFDFWNRWNITLSTWLRDFVFMRLTRLIMRRHLIRDRVRTAQVALVANMVVMGLWHGLTGDYVLYGIYHGVLLALTQGFQKRSRFYRRHRDDRWFRVLSWFVTLQLVVLGLAIFSGQLSTLVKGALDV